LSNTLSKPAQTPARGDESLYPESQAHDKLAHARGRNGGWD
jgi:hypothetical protein